MLNAIASNIPSELSVDDPRFPEKLRATSFSMSKIWVKGNLDILDKPAVGICGARNASPIGLGHAKKFGQMAAEYGIAVVSGYSRGVDINAHFGALEAGGCTIAVLPEGINGFKLRRELTGIHDIWSKLLVVSEFEPSHPWTVWRAMKRNATICGLADATVVVEAGQTGGTIAAGNECLRQHKPLWVINYEDVPSSALGNAQLITLGGVPLHSLRELREMMEQVTLVQTRTHICLSN